METVNNKIMNLSDSKIRYQSRSTQDVKKTVSIEPTITSVFEYVCQKLDCKPSEVRNELLRESVLAQGTTYQYNSPHTEFLKNIHSHHGTHDPCVKNVHGLDIHLREMELEDIVDYFEIVEKYEIRDLITVILADIDGVTYPVISAREYKSRKYIKHNDQEILFAGLPYSNFNDIAKIVWRHHVLKEFRSSKHENNSDKLLDLKMNHNSDDYYQLYEQSSSKPFASFPIGTDTSMLKDYIVALSNSDCEIDIVFEKDETQYVINTSNLPYPNDSFERLLWSNPLKLADSIYLINPHVNLTKTPDENYLIKSYRSDTEETNILETSDSNKNSIGDVIQYFYNISVEDSDTSESRDLFVELQVRPQFATKGSRLDRHQYNHLDMKFIVCCDETDFNDINEDGMKSLMVNHMVDLFIYDLYMSNALPSATVSFEVLDDSKDFITLPSLTKRDLSLFNRNNNSEGYTASHLKYVTIE